MCSHCCAGENPQAQTHSHCHAPPDTLHHASQTLSTRTETPEFLSSLSTLSEFYGDNTAAERRKLRSTIEQQGLAIDTRFLAAAETVIASLDAMDADLEQLSSYCCRVGSSLASSKVGCFAP